MRLRDQIIKNRHIFVMTGVVCILLSGLYIAGFQAPCYYLNLSSSEPLGVYKLVPFDGHLQAGELVIFDVPEQARPYIYGRGWLPEKWPLIKEAGAVPGDVCRISDRAITVNGKYIGPVFSVDGNGRPLPRLRGVFSVGPGYFLPVSTKSPNSFDGRYFGPVAFNRIRGKAVPVLLF